MFESEAARWRKIRELVDAALELPPIERIPFLRAQCAGDPSMLAVAEQLLRALEAARSRLEQVNPTVSAGPPPEAPSAAGFEPGSRIGPYVIAGELGRGGFGIVYKAERMKPVRHTVALKLIGPDATSPDAIHYFDRERQALALMVHPGIARFLEAGVTAEGQQYFAMEWVPGERIDKHCDLQRLGIRRRIEIFIRACEAVLYAHQKTILHRDLKPANILVTQEGQRAQPKVIDFGLAKALTHPLVGTAPPTQMGRILGTFGYLAPEQAEGPAEGVSVLADQYALGAILYQLVTGLPPLEFEGLTLVEAIRLTCDVEPPPPSQRLAAYLQRNPAGAQHIAAHRDTSPTALVRTLRRELDWITLKCLEKSPDRRYRGVDQLIEDLEHYLALEPTRAGRPSLSHRARKFARRHRVAVAGATLVGALSVAGLVTGAKLMAAEKRARDAWAENKRSLDAKEAQHQLDIARRLFLNSANLARPGFDLDPIADPGTRRMLRTQLEETLQRAVELDPNLVEAETLRVQALVLDGDRAAAVDLARHVRRRHPRSGEALASLAGLLAGSPEADALEPRMAALHVPEKVRIYHRASATADPGAAIALLERCIDLDPWHFEAHWQLAVRLSAVDDCLGMLRVTDTLTRARPKVGFVWTLHAKARSSLGDDVGANEDLGEAIARDPGNWRNHYDRAVARHRLGWYGLALEDARAADELAPGNAEVHALQGSIYSRSGNEAWAVAEYDEAIRLGARHFWVHFDRGGLLRVLGHADAAIADFDAALAMVKDGPPLVVARVRGERGLALCGLRRLDAARADLEAASDLQPGNMRYLANLGRLHLVSRRYSDAVDVYDAVLRAAPNSSIAIDRAVALWFSGDEDGAKPVFESWAARPGYEVLHLWLWDLDASRGRRAEADEALDRAEALGSSGDPILGVLRAVLRGQVPESEVTRLDLDDSQLLLACYLAGAHARLDGRPADAAEWYRRALALGRTDDFEHDIVEHEARSL